MQRSRTAAFFELNNAFEVHNTIGIILLVCKIDDLPYAICVIFTVSESVINHSLGNKKW